MKSLRNEVLKHRVLIKFGANLNLKVPVKFPMIFSIQKCLFKMLPME